MTNFTKTDQDGIQWITIAEAARRLSTTSSVFKRIITERGIEFTNFGNSRRIYIQWHDFEKLVYENLGGGASPKSLSKVR